MRCSEPGGGVAVAIVAPRAPGRCAWGVRRRYVMSACLYIDLELTPTTVTESFFHTLDAALATHHFLLASESLNAGEMVA